MRFRIEHAVAAAQGRTAAVWWRPAEYALGAALPTETWRPRGALASRIELSLGIRAPEGLIVCGDLELRLSESGKLAGLDLFAGAVHSVAGSAAFLDGVAVANGVFDAVYEGELDEHGRASFKAPLHVVHDPQRRAVRILIGGGATPADQWHQLADRLLLVVGGEGPTPLREIVLREISPT